MTLVYYLETGTPHGFTKVCYFYVQMTRDIFTPTWMATLSPDSPSFVIDIFISHDRVLCSAFYIY
jgi:hypothetical protein